MAGRPAHFESVEQLDKEISAYFKFIEGEQETIEENGEKQIRWKRNPEPPTITGLALYIGFESRQSFYDYESNEPFSYTIKRARLMIENEYEKGLHKAAPTGAIFALKNFGWKDKTEVEQSGGLHLTWNEQKSYEAERKTD